MARWSQFGEEAPELADRGRVLLYQFGVALGFLATVRADGGPRLHPFCPIQTQGSLFGLIGPSPKQADLLRDGRFAIHSFPCPDRDDEFYLTGRAIWRDDAALEELVRAAYEGGSDHSERLFEFDLERALLATYKKRGEPDNWPPEYAKWSAGG